MCVNRCMRMPALVAVIALTFTACQADSSPESATTTPPTDSVAADGTGSQIPDVSGQQAHIALTHLRQSGYEHFSWAGRASNQPVGTVLATSPAIGTATPRGVRVRLIMSEGPSRSPSRFVMVPGIGTCDVDPLPPGTPCVGGPVMLPMRP
jgi:hypothetical protein